MIGSSLGFFVETESKSDLRQKKVQVEDDEISNRKPFPCPLVVMLEGRLTDDFQPHAELVVDSVKYSDNQGDDRDSGSNLR